ncbi:aminoacyl-tRNA deacylase [Alkalitalea saponilacus]|uniref:Ala-tRNA(Pro) deacylase n=1 Tax=Alkalitalea saponilacus TaxID=889453 RepID=A0A1T5BRF8_9BACT|nr:YbaK/EbsC family protein [Alkalitalea saponilacus]ASB49617.1 deacylase [Alkalitalea saponilacus]SKB49972.1 Ala-tRNA(Pro) deacylase [Alkalitalea saponilacus]
MPVQVLKNYLDKHGIRYLTISHSKAYTMQKIAALTHISGNEIAKTVMVKVDGKMVMAVLPASTRINFSAFKEYFDATEVRLALESEFKDVFPHCEVGAMPPFGNLWNIPVFVAEKLTRQKNISFNAGNHMELIQMSYKDYDQLVQPYVFQYAYQSI